MSKIGVVGGGIIGSTIAARLIGHDHDVTLFEAEPNGLPASSGNAALIALPEIAPLASPGVFMSVPGWLLDPLGPLTLRWADLPALTPWLLAFLRSSTPSRGMGARQALASLMRTALQDHVALGKTVGLTDHLRQTGYLSVHDSEKSVDEALKEAQLVKTQLGYDFERLSTVEAQKLVPQLEGDFAGAVHQPVYWTVTNPLDVLRHYQRFVSHRCKSIAAKVSSVEPREDCVVVHAAEEEQRFDRIVIAAGVWSRELVRALGVKVLLEAERGYNTTFTDLDWNLPMPVGFADHGFIATPLVDGLRVGGAVELAKPDTPANYNRAKAMRTKMRRYVPSLPEGGTEWMGRRPSTPDSLPVISRHPQDNRIVFAFGHGHLGLTLSAVTARLVANLIASPQTDPALAPFDIKRFG